MDKSDTKQELEALLRNAEKNRIELQKSWRKVEALDAAIQAAQQAQGDRRMKRKEK